MLFSAQKKIKMSFDQITIIIILIFFFYFMIEDSMGIVIPLFFEEKKINIILYGTLLTFTRIMRAVIVVPISLQPLSRKFIILKAVFIADVIILLGFTQTSSPVMAFAGFSILIITTSVVNVILNPILGMQANDRIGFVFGIRDAFLYTGCFLGLLIAGAIKDLSNGTNLIWGFYCCIFGLLFLIISRLEKQMNQKKVGEASKEKRAEEEAKKSRGPLGMSRSLIYYIAVTFILGIAGAYTSYLPLIAAQVGIKENSIFYIFSSAAFFSAVLAISGGLAIDRFNKKRLFQLDILILIVILSLYSTANQTVFTVAVVLSGLAAALDNVSNAYVFVNFSDHEINRFWGVIGSVNLVSFSIGTFLGGLLYQFDYRYVLVFAMVVNILGLILSLKLKNIEKESV